MLIAISLITLTCRAQLVVQLGFTRQAPIFMWGQFKLPPQNGIKLGCGAWTSEGLYFGLKCGFFLPVTDTFSAMGHTPSWSGTIPVLCTRRTVCFGIHFPFSLTIYKMDFFNFYGGLDIGLLIGSSDFTYSSALYDNVTPTDDYPDEGKSKIRAFPGGMHVGVSYEFERLTPYAEAGFIYQGLNEIPGVNVAWGTVEAGVLIHINGKGE